MNRYRRGRDLGVSRRTAFRMAVVPIRAEVLWNVLRGRPVMWRMRVVGQVNFDLTHRALIADCYFVAVSPDGERSDEFMR